ncbi:MAG: PIN domain-containing protein [Deltaproteobacteria bacterium]|nr:PIN domain-containing protein [Deltaproteobacteria bacterium]
MSINTLVDSSIWIDHFHKPNQKLITLLEHKEVLIHSAVLGELAAGELKNRVKTISDLKQIPLVTEVQSIEVLEFIENKNLFGKGLSWVDIQILASCLVSNCYLLTNDKQLYSVFMQIK